MINSRKRDGLWVAELLNTRISLKLKVVYSSFSCWVSFLQICQLCLDLLSKRKQSSGMRTDRTVTRMSSDRVAMRPIVDRNWQTPVKTLPSLVVGTNWTKVKF